LAVDWSTRSGYIVAEHDLTPEQALPPPTSWCPIPTTTPNAASKSALSSYSPDADTILAIINVEHQGITYGANAWKFNSHDRRSPWSVRPPAPVR